METVIKKYSSLLGQLDRPTLTHSKNVAEACRFLAESVKLDADVAYIAGYLHDVGKMYIPSRILNKNSGLDNLERRIVDLHAYYGYELIRNIEEDERIYLSALYHHGFEKPTLSEVRKDISYEVRKYIQIVHSADIYDALTMSRVYHEPFTAEQIFNILSTDELCTDEIRHALVKFNKRSEVQEETIA